MQTINPEVFEKETNSNKIEKEDIKAAFDFLFENYQQEANFENSNVTQEMIKSNIDHAKRVIENVKKIAEEYEKQTKELLTMLKSENIKTLDDFIKIFNQFVKEENINYG